VSIDALAADLAHEVRNPLVAVKSFLELLGERGADAELARSFLPIAVEELRRAERLLGLFAALREGGTPESAAGGAGEAIAAVAALLAPRAQRLGVRLEAARDEALPPAALGPDALRQVVLNLALNALEASPRGGTVRIAARAARGGIEIAVSDEGPGLGAGTPRGAARAARGRGLAITRRLLEAAGGGLGYGSTDGGGAELRAFVRAV
jgi:signal transduction histidine kinase